MSNLSFKKFLVEYNNSTFDKGNDEERNSTRPLHDRLREHYYTIPNEENYSDLSYVDSYKDYSKQINGDLWDSHKNGNLYKDYKPPGDVAAIDRHLDKEKAPEDFTVYSATRHDPRHLMNKERIVHHPAYVSTTLRKHFAIMRSPEVNIKGEPITNINSKEDVHHHILKFNIKKGSKKGHYVSANGSDSEREFLGKRGLNLRHISTHDHSDEENNVYKDSSTYPGRGKHFYHTHEMEIL